ncbi:hypothetical protein PMG11_11157 [Penicillium brasilianum]|uniref:DUF7580 domain-containing protein n=1 Tax=Penicillium brasilianum TaxID=104259 RepID=A0A0F7U1B9_PENBI|nr:hypothetical protein PMG11_11157 [Penicillium brasilianum]
MAVSVLLYTGVTLTCVDRHFIFATTFSFFSGQEGFMSGIEVAGLLLGALPILFKAVDLSKDSIQRGRFFIRKRHYVQKLALALLLQRQTLAETVRSILIRSGCEDILLLDDDPVGYLKDECVQNRILDYLGPENAAAFTGVLKQCDDSVRRIAKNISDLVPATKNPTADLLAILKLNQEVNNRWLDLIPKAKLAFRASELKGAIQDLDDTTNALDRFTKIISSNRMLLGDTSSRKATKLANALRQFRGFAHDLYLAIFQGWREECHDKHEARLFLEDRVDTAADVLKEVRKCAPILLFQLVFAASSLQGQTLWNEAIVQVLKQGSDDDLNVSLVSRPSESSRVKLVVPESTSAGTELTFIDNICAAIETARRGERHISFVLTGNQKMATMPSHEETVITCHQADKITLKALLLRDDNSSHTSTLLPLRLRMLLALRLASNLLQLLQTQWLRSGLSKDDIFFLLRPSDDVNNASHCHLHIDIGRPFVSLTFDDSNANVLPEQNIDPKIALLELGILLLEIWHKTTLESQFSLKESPVEYYERLTLALKWLDDMNDPLPQLYDKAASHCVRGIVGGEPRFWDWEDSGFWSAFCGNIIEPLSRNCKQWR